MMLGAMTQGDLRRLAFTLVTSVIGTALAIAQQPPPPKLTPLGGTGRITYFIAEGIEKSGHRPGDTELAVWALNEWERAAEGAIRFEHIGSEGTALIRIYWLPWAREELGQTRPFMTRGHRASSVFIRPDIERVIRRASEDPIMRETILFLVCLHELGHALGLGHTTDNTDIMWEGGHGQDSEVFERHRKRVRTRDSIRDLSWLSAADIKRLKFLYPRP